MIVTFEGIDGAGTTTQSKLLYDYLRDTMGEDMVAHYRAPGGTEAGEDIRNVIMGHDNLTRKTELFLFNAARAELVDKRIKPMVEKGGVVILDRYYPSTISYQSINTNMTVEQIQWMIDLTVGEYTSDIIFYLDISPKEAVRRKGIKKNRFDMQDIGYYNKVRNNYINQLNESWRLLDGTLDEETILGMVVFEFERFIGTAYS